MIEINDAIFAINPSIVTIRGDVAYDKDENVVAYDKSAAEAKLAELELVEIKKQQDKNEAYASALSKLTALGLTADEVTAILGVK